MDTNVSTGYTLLLLGIGGMLITGNQQLDTNAIATNGIATEATVIHVNKRRTADGDRKYTPVYRFKDRNGQEFTGQLDIGIINYKVARKGEKIADHLRSI